MFRFTIRELVLLTLVVAMGVGWWIDSRSNRRAQATLHQHVETLVKQANVLKREALAEAARRIELQSELNLAKVENIRLRVKRESSPPTISLP